jgi:hypothetical protein
MKRSLLGVTVIALSWTAMVAFPGRADAQTALVGSDIPAAIVTFPLVRVDVGIDTFIQMANTNQTDVRAAQCFYINGLGRCSASGDACLVNFDCPGGLLGETCVPNWAEANFFIDFTPQQPLGWVASEGLDFLPCDPLHANPNDGSQASCGIGDDVNGAGGVSAVDAPFRGFLTCVTITAIDNTIPAPENDLIGTATVLVNDPGGLDSYTYNGIGIQSTGLTQDDQYLCLGGAAGTNCPDAEYASCPQTLILNHLFDGSTPDALLDVRTRLTLIPCTQLEAPRPTRQAPDVVPTTAQFLIFNEFEQKTSTSTRVACFSDLLLSDIDTRPSFEGDNTNSVFNIAVQGTVGGQTRIRGVATAETDVGHGLLGVAVQTVTSEAGSSSAAVNLNFVGVRGQPDVICTAQGACEPAPVGP